MLTFTSWSNCVTKDRERAIEFRGRRETRKPNSLFWAAPGEFLLLTNRWNLALNTQLFRNVLR